MTAKNILAGRLTVRVIVLMLSIATSVVIWGAIRNSDLIDSSVAPNQVKTEDGDKLEKLRQKYAAIKSVHIMAEARITLYGDNFRVGTGSYEYWAEGNRYKVKCHTDSYLGFLPDVDLAYDGKRFYHLERATGLLTYKNQDVSATIGALPNPLFMPVNFLSPEDDDCRFCGLRMIDFKSQIARWSDRAARVKVKSQHKDPNTGYTFTDIELPGGTKAKRPSKIKVRVTDTADGQLRTSRIEETTVDGKLLTATTFDDFIGTSLGQFPRTIVLEGFDEKSNLLIRMAYSVKALELDQPVDSNVFEISFGEAERVWDNDAARLVKEKHPKTSRP